MKTNKLKQFFCVHKLIKMENTITVAALLDIIFNGSVIESYNIYNLKHQCRYIDYVGDSYNILNVVYSFIYNEKKYTFNIDLKKELPNYKMIEGETVFDYVCYKCGKNFLNIDKFIEVVTKRVIQQIADLINNVKEKEVEVELAKSFYVKNEHKEKEL